MFDWLKKVRKEIKNLNVSVNSYQKDSVIQSLPTVAYVNKAKRCLEGGNYAEAEVILKKALDISQQDPLVYRYLGKINEKQGKFSQAVEYYTKSSKINPQDKEVWLRLGMSQLNSKMFEEAIASFEKANKVSPMNTDVYTGWGMALMRLKKYKLARDKFLTAIKINKYNYTAILLSAVMEVRLCDYESAEMKLAFLTKVAPNESSTYEYANLKLLKSNYKEAEMYATKSININPQMLPSYFILGEIYSLQKNMEKTEKTFRIAMSNGLESSSLHYEWGKAYLRFFNYEKAQEQFEISLQQEPDLVEAKTGLALTQAHKQNFSILDSLKEKYGENVYIQEAIGLEKYYAGQFGDAAEMFKKALRTDNKQTYNYFNLAKVYAKMNDKVKTREFFDKFTLENPEYLNGLLEYSKWLVEISDFAEAQRKLRKAEKLDGNNSEILNLLFYCAYKLVKDNVCEYNIKEAISVADRIEPQECFIYKNEYNELKGILENLQGNN